MSITGVPQDENWWYLGCRICKKSSSDYVAGAPWCKDCNVTEFKPRYKLSITAADATADAPFFCFDAIGYHIVKNSAEAVLQAHGGGAGTPAALTAIIGNRYTFAVGLTAESYHTNDPKIYLINRVEDFQRRVPPPRRSMQLGSSQNVLPTKDLLISTASDVTKTTQVSSSSALVLPSLSAASLASLEAVQTVLTLPSTPPSTEQLLAAGLSDQR